MGRARIAPGTHNIDRVRAHTRSDRPGKKFISWTGVLENGQYVEGRAQGSTVGEARQRARLQWEKRVQAAQAFDGTPWTAQDLIKDFVKEVSKPAIEQAKLTDSTKARYREALAHYTKTVGQRQLWTLRTPPHSKKIIEEVAKNVGVATAIHVKTVLSKYVVDLAVEHGILERNNIRDLSIPALRADSEEQERYIPSRQDWEDLIKIVYEDDPEEPMPGKKSPAARKADARARHSRARALTLIQMCSGLRISEARQLTWELVNEDSDGQIWLTVTKEISKTKKARTVPLLGPPEVSNVLKKSRREASDFVIPAPADMSKKWERRAAQKAIRDYYDGLAEVHPKVKWLSECSSHVWRHTLTTALAGSLPAEIRGAYFGHTREEDEVTYTNHVDVRPVLTSAKAILTVNNLQKKSG